MSSEGDKLKELILKAISDLKVTTSEYNEIIKQADSDMVLDNEEKALLKQLNEMISNKTIDRVPD